MASEGLDWKFSQVFGERAAGEDVHEVDIIPAIEFDKSGDLLATGDRVVLFERINKANHVDNRRHLEGVDCSSSRHPEFRYKTEFRSHEPEVQEKKIKKIYHMNIEPPKSTSNGFVSASNVPTMYKPHTANGGGIDKYSSCMNNILIPLGKILSLRLPMVTGHETSLVARCRRTYAHAHDYDINFMFRVFGCSEGSSEETTLEATKNPTRGQVQTPPRFPRSPGTLPRVSRRGSNNSGDDINGSTYDFSTKLLHLAWHPNENSIACAASNSLYMYHA